MSEPTAEELKPCPFCGGEARLIRGDEVAAVQCANHAFHRLILDGDNNAAAEVIAAWNNRPAEQERAK